MMAEVFKNVTGAVFFVMMIGIGEGRAKLAGNRRLLSSCDPFQRENTVDSYTI